jgi:RimJ/RimL family protein N-acetyltransferase
MSERPMHRTISTSVGAFILRTTSADDAATYRELRLESLWMHPEAFATDHAESAAKPIEWWRDRAAAGAGDGNQVLYVAEAHDGELVGMCGLFREHGPKLQHTGHVWGVYVRPAWRGLKIADALMDACEAWARERGVRVIRLAVVEGNNAARRCYERRGFNACGVAPEAIHHNGTYYDELLMAKHVAEPSLTQLVMGESS